MLLYLRFDQIFNTVSSHISVDKEVEAKLVSQEDEAPKEVVNAHVSRIHTYFTIAAGHCQFGAKENRLVCSVINISAIYVDALAQY